MRDHPQRATRAIHDFQRRRNHHGPNWGKLVKVAEPSQPKLTAAVHDVVIGKRWVEGRGASSIRSHCFYSYPQNISFFGEELRALFHEAGRMWAILLKVDVFVRISAL